MQASLTPPIDFDKVDDRAKAIFQPWEPDSRINDAQAIQQWALQIRGKNDLFSSVAVFLSDMIRRTIPPDALRNLSDKEWLSAATDIINQTENYVRGVVDYMSYRMFFVLRQALARADAIATNNTLVTLLQLSSESGSLVTSPSSQNYALASFPIDVPVSDALLKGTSSSGGGPKPMALAYSRDFFLVNSDVWTKSSAAQAREQQKASAKKKLDDLKKRLKEEAMNQVNADKRQILEQKDQADRQLSELRSKLQQDKIERDLDFARKKDEIEREKNNEIATLRANALAEKSDLQSQLRQYQAELRQYQLDRQQLINLQAANRDIERRRAEAESSVQQLLAQRQIDLAEFQAKANVNAQFAIAKDQLTKWKQFQVQSGKDNNERSSTLATVTRDRNERLKQYTTQLRAISENADKTADQKAAENKVIQDNLVQEEQLGQLLEFKDDQAALYQSLLAVYPGVDPNSIDGDVVELERERLLVERVRRAQDLNLRAQVAFDQWKQSIELARKEEISKGNIKNLEKEYQQKLAEEERKAKAYNDYYLQGKARLNARKAYDTAYLKSKGREETRVAKNEGEREGNYEKVTKRSAERRAKLEGRIQFNQTQLPAVAAQEAERNRINRLIEALGALITRENALVTLVLEARAKKPLDEAHELAIAEENDSLEQEILSLEETDASNRRLQRFKEKLNNKLRELAQQQEIREADRKARNNMRKSRKRGTQNAAGALPSPPPPPPLNLTDSNDSAQPPREPEEEEDEEERLIPGRLAELRRRATREAIDWHKEIANYILEAPVVAIQNIAKELISPVPRSSLALPAEIMAYDAEQANFYYTQILRLMNDELAELRNDEVFKRLVDGKLRSGDDLPNLVPVLYLEFWQKLLGLTVQTPTPPVPKAPTKRTDEPGLDDPPSKKKPAAVVTSTTTTSSSSNIPAPDSNPTTPAPAQPKGSSKSKRKNEPSAAEGSSSDSSSAKEEEPAATPPPSKKNLPDNTQPMSEPIDLSALSIQETEEEDEEDPPTEEAPKATITMKASHVVGGEDFY